MTSSPKSNVFQITDEDIDKLRAGQSGIYFGVHNPPKSLNQLRPFYWDGRRLYTNARGRGKSWEPMNAKLDLDKGVVVTDHHYVVALDPKTFKAPPPKPTKFTNNKENRDRIAAHVAKLSDFATLFIETVGTQARAITLLGMMNPVGTTISVKLGGKMPDLGKDWDDANKLYAPLKDLDDTERRCILRHIAHLFDIPKGKTWVR